MERPCPLSEKWIGHGLLGHGLIAPASTVPAVETGDYFVHIIKAILFDRKHPKTIERLSKNREEEEEEEEENEQH